MTQYSLRVFDAGCCCVGATDEQPFKPGPLIQDLDPYARRCGPYGAAVWANRRGLDIRYEDNCWVYIVVDSDDLKEFICDVLDGACEPDPRIRPNRRYLLMAEEF